MNFRKSEKVQIGFTLLELLMVLLIIGLLAALVGPALYKKISPAKTSVAAVQIENFVNALDTYFIDTSEYPSAAQGLKSLRQKPAGVNGWDGPYLKKEVPKDPWGNDYHYKSPGRSGGFEIYSYGRDGKQGGEGPDVDIVSWKNI